MYLENLVMDATEPQRLGRFWEAALGGERLTDEPDGFETRLAAALGRAPDRYRAPHSTHHRRLGVRLRR